MTFLDWAGTTEPGLFPAARIRAIEGYAEIEASLSVLFANLLHIPFDRAGIVFFRVANTKFRNLMIEDLLGKEHGERFTHYWLGVPGTPYKRGLMSLIYTLDRERNEIVHWHQVLRATTDGSYAPPFLTKPNIWDHEAWKPEKNTADLMDFIDRADFVSRSITMFTMVTTGVMDHTGPDNVQAWLQIFSQPAIWPIPPDHLLAQNPAVPRTPHPPSRA